MSRHWKPETKSARPLAVQTRKLPAGATAGLLLVAAACVGAAVVLYQVTAPRSVFEKDAPFE